MVDIAPGLDRFEARLVPDAAPATGRSASRAGRTRTAPGCTTRRSRSRPGVDVELMLAEGALLLERAAARTGADAMPKAAARVLKDAVMGLRDIRDSPRRAPRGRTVRARCTRSWPTHPLRDVGDARRRPTRCASTVRSRWRAPGTSCSPARRVPRTTTRPASGRSGTLRTAAARPAPRSPAMGFDVVYLTPIHPIGTTHRKGRNNSLRRRAGRPGLAVRDRLAGRRARRDRADPGHVRRLRRVRRARPATWAWRSRSTSRCSARPTTRG